MKRCLLFFLMMPQLILAVSDTLESLYRQGAYQEILDTYADAANNAAEWCVIGNAAYCLQKYNKAYLYWLRAQRYGNAHIYYASTNNMLRLQSHGFVPQEHKVYTWLIWLSKYVGIYIFQILFLFVWYALCIMVYNKKRSLLLAGMLGIACTLLMPIIIAYHFDKEKGLLMEDATIYNGPNSGYYNIGSVSKGTLVYIKDVRDDWVNITYNNTIGWIGKTDVGIL